MDALTALEIFYDVNGQRPGSAEELQQFAQNLEIYITLEDAARAIRGDVAEADEEEFAAEDPPEAVERVECGQLPQKANAVLPEPVSYDTPNYNTKLFDPLSGDEIGVSEINPTDVVLFVQLGTGFFKGTVYPRESLIEMTHDPEIIFAECHQGKFDYLGEGRQFEFYIRLEVSGIKLMIPYSDIVKICRGEIAGAYNLVATKKVLSQVVSLPVMKRGLVVSRSHCDGPSHTVYRMIPLTRIGVPLTGELLKEALRSSGEDYSSPGTSSAGQNAQWIIKRDRLLRERALIQRQMEKLSDEGLETEEKQDKMHRLIEMMGEIDRDPVMFMYRYEREEEYVMEEEEEEDQEVEYVVDEEDQEVEYVMEEEEDD